MKTLDTAQLQRTQRGYSLAEVMVAMAVFTIIMLAALTIYDRSNKVFNQGVQASDMQQSARVAFDKLVSDVRLAGFDYDRDGIPFGAMAPTWTNDTSYVAGNLVQPDPINGHTYICTTGGKSGASQPTWPTVSKDSVTDNEVTWQEQGLVQYQQPDEQIEYAGAAAITLRANFDYETEVGPCAASGTPHDCENGREAELQSTQFPVVTTDNDEIVTYALKSNSSDTKANKDSIVFYADTDRPRDVNPNTKKKENKITITGVDTTNLYPPYTLYRYTLKKTGEPIDTPIADNIRSMSFTYYTDNAGTIPVAAFPNGDGQYDASSPDTQIAGRDTRAEIKSIRVSLTGMNPNQDAAYTDADAAAPHYRKYSLSSLVVPRNVGKHGMKEFTTTAPEDPTIKTVCKGACNAVYVTWTAPVKGGDVDSYNIVYDEGDCGGADSCSGCNVTYATAEDAGTNLAGYATKITPGKKYRFAVQSINKYGSMISTNCIAATILNSTTPAGTTALDASGGTNATYPVVANGIHLYWPPVTTNDPNKASTSCTDGTTKTESNIPPGEDIRYRIYRSKTANFQIPTKASPALPTGTTLVLTETGVQPTAAGSLLTWTDATAPLGSCIDYYYRVQPVSYKCCTADSMNTTDKWLAVGAPFPDPASANGIKGRTETTGTPAAPAGLGLTSVACAGNGNICDVTVSWNAVTQDTAGKAMFIDSYTAMAIKNDGATPVNVVDSVTTHDGITTAKFNNLNQVNSYYIVVKANDCNISADSAKMYWPCNWDGGNISVTAGSFGGSGLPGDPWIVQYPGTITVATDNNIAKVDAIVTQGNTQMGSTITKAGPAKTFNISLPKTDDGVPARVHLTLTATGGCALNGDYYVIDEPAPSCALKTFDGDSTVVDCGGKVCSSNQAPSYFTLTLKNTLADVLKPKKAWVTFYSKQKNTKLQSYTAPGAGTVSSSCDPAGNSGTALVAFPSSITDIPGISVAWTASKAYAVGAVVRPTTSNGHSYIATVAGTSAATQPTWPTTSGATVTDGSVTWKENGPDPYQIRFDFSAAPFNPPSQCSGCATPAIYVEYQSKFGDILICKVYPNSGTGTEPASACQ